VKSAAGDDATNTGRVDCVYPLVVGKSELSGRLHMMNGTTIRRGVTTAGLMALCLTFSTAMAAHPAAGEDGSVKVTVKYSGKGDVDDSHRLWVWLFDSPNIGAGSIPIAETSVDKYGGVATFDVSAPQVWIAAAYDVHGGFAGMAPPPSGSPASAYGIAAGGAPAPVTPGENGAVTFAFDDTFKMP
jgi:hypothetical protein